VVEFVVESVVGFVVESVVGFVVESVVWFVSSKNSVKLVNCYKYTYSPLFPLKRLYTMLNTSLLVNYVNNSSLLVHDVTVSKLSEGMEYFRSTGTRPLSEGMGVWIPV